MSRTTDAMKQSIAESQAGVTMQMLSAIASHLAGVRGRKNLVWVSSGVPYLPLGPASLLTAFNRTSNAMDDANIAIYPVDARGLVVAGVSDASTGPPIAAMRGNVTSTPDVPQRGVAQTTPNLEAMKQLAANTGGRAFFNGNDIAAAVGQALDDGRHAYLLGYYPTHGKWDGTFRKLEVKVNRPDVRALHRSGYLAVPASPLGATTRNEELLEQGRSPFAATGIGLTARVSPSDTTARGSRDVSLVIHVDPGAITLVKTGEEWSGSLDLAIVQSAADGGVVKSVAGSVDIQAPAARYERLVKEGFAFNRTLTLSDDVDRVHVVLRDVRSGAMGSLIVPVAAIGRVQN
jgi:hypothetical protein